MKKSDKLNILSSAKGTYDLCRCYFNYDDNYWYYYILDYSDKFIFGIEESDFLLDGFQIRKISELKKIELKNDLCTKINMDNKILENVSAPVVKLSSWHDVFISLCETAKFIIVQNENDMRNGPYFYLGKIIKVKKSSVILLPFDADGEWFEDVELPFSEITSVTFGDRYSTVFGEYISK